MAKPGRSFGTDANFVAENKIVKEILKNKKWVGDNQKDARNVLTELMNDIKTPATIRKGIAEFFIKQGEQHYKEQDGKVNKTNPEEKKKPKSFNLKFKETGTGE